MRIGVILSGCGVQDGSEIQEAVLLLLAIDRAGAQAVCYAPDKAQFDVIDHVSGKPMGETRGVLRESARIARGDIRALGEAAAAGVDAVILPGGFGAAKNLCTFAQDGAACKVDPEVRRFLLEVHQARKPIGAACIAPVLLAKLLEDEHPLLTIGSEAGTAAAIERMGGRHEQAPAAGVVVDEERRLASTPCYMLATRISQVADGMDALVGAVLRLAAA